jgi:hypothetical protein
MNALDMGSLTKKGRDIKREDLVTFFSQVNKSTSVGPYNESTD